MVAQLNKLTATSKVGLKPSEGRACKTKTIFKSVKQNAMINSVESRTVI